MNGIRVEGVTFRYRGGGFRLEVRELVVAPGKVTALVGPNGAGKTTLLHVVAGLLPPDAGTVLVGGRPAESRLREGGIGFCPDSFPPAGRRTLRAWAGWIAELREGRTPGPGAIDALAAGLGVTGLLDRPLGRLSRGQAKRAGLLLALVGEPPVVLLDEPTAYLDPDAVVLLRETILGLRERGVTVLVSSHHLDELERIADEAVFLSRGRLVSHERVPGGAARPCELVVSAWPGEARRRWSEADWTPLEDGRVRVRVPCAAEAELARIEGFLLGAGERVYEVRLPGGSLEERYRDRMDSRDGA